MKNPITPAREAEILKLLPAGLPEEDLRDLVLVCVDHCGARAATYDRIVSVMAADDKIPSVGWDLDT